MDGKRTRRSRATTATISSVVTAVLFVNPFGLGAVSSAFADGPDLAQRSEDFANVVDGLDLGDASPAETLTGAWPAFDESGGLGDLPAEAPEEDEQVVVLSGGGGNVLALAGFSNDPEPPTPPTPVDINLGGIDVTVAPSADPTATPDALTVRIAGEAETAAAGVTGLLLDLVDASEQPVSDPSVKLTVSYEDLVGFAGGDWASRLRFVWIPDCDTPGPDCRETVIPTVNDAAQQTVTAIVPVQPEPETTTPALAGYTQMTNEATSAGGSVAVTAGASGDSGSWAATSLSPSATWGAGGSTGSFSWSLPIDVPSAPVGPAPDLSISYSSSVSDGKVPSSNSQSGVIGEGFDLTTGYIERSYVPCSQDDDGDANNANLPSGDLCWGKQNATMVFNGSAVELIRVGTTNTWRAKFDDGTLVQRLTGSNNAGDADEYWKVTTADGTQYFFGKNQRPSSTAVLNSAWTVPVFGNNPGEPCYDASFEDSKCRQVWRWNLEYVVDPQGNSMTYFYSAETNYYVSNYWQNYSHTTSWYNSGGHLNRIEFGTHKNHEDEGSAPAKVTFANLPRCITTTSNPSSWCGSGDTNMKQNHWLDSPTDLACTAAEDQCRNVSPIFFDKYRLSSIATWGYDGSAYQPVDKWAFGQRFSAQGTGGVTNAEYPMLVLDSVTHIGQGGTTDISDDIPVPPTLFGYSYLPNRVDTDNDGAAPMVRPRVTSIRTDSGAGITIDYRTECEGNDHPGIGDGAQAANTRLCYPVKWYPFNTPVTQYFHKYVVDTLVESGAAPASGSSELITGSLAKVTHFEYEGAALWKKPTGAMIKPKEVTYSDFRGFGSVLTTVGTGDDRVFTRTSYYRGSGTALTAGPSAFPVTVNDVTRFQGQVFSTVQLEGTTVVSETVNEPGVPVESAQDSSGAKATRIPSNTAFSFTYGTSGDAVIRSKSVTALNSDGQTVSIDDSGDLSTANDDTCTTIAYANNAALVSNHVVALPALMEKLAKPCGQPVSRPADVISSEKTTYDDAGRITKTERLDPVDGVGYVVVNEVQSFDALGRPQNTVDANGSVSSTVYTQSAGGLPATKTTTTPDPDGAGPLHGFATKTTFNPLTGNVLSTEDPNGRVTSGTYDALGRLRTVRYPQHAGFTLPSISYDYSTNSNGLNAVETKTLNTAGTGQRVSTALYDGLLRPFQYQTEGLDAGADHDLSGASLGRLVQHLYYNSAGSLSSQTGKWWAEGAPSLSPIVPLASPPTQTTYEYDTVGRTTAEIFWVGPAGVPEHEKWRTSTYYYGSTTLVVPPMGASPSATVKDAAGRTVELQQYLRDPDGSATIVSLAEVRDLPHQSTTYNFDAAGRMVAMHDPEGNDWTFEFDWGGRQTRTTDPDSGVTTATYDLNDRVVSRTNGAGQTLAYTYDSLGRNTTLRDNSPSGPIRVAWEYDKAVDTAGQPVLGMPSKSTRFIGDDEYVSTVDLYDAANRPLATTLKLPDIPEFDALESRAFTTKSTFTADGQTASTLMPAVSDASGHKVLGNETVTTSYDTVGLPSWMSGGFGWGTYVAESRYSAEGRVAALDLGTTYGSYLTYAYEDATDRLAAIKLQRQNFGMGVDLRYEYDAAGNVVSLKDKASGTPSLQDNQCFGYDGLERLAVAWTAATGDCSLAQGSIAKGDVGGVSPYWTEYGFDAVGNRTSMIEHGLASVPDSVTTYNQGSSAPHRVTDTLTSASGVTGTQEFVYDGAGRRTAMTSSGHSESYVWDAEGKLNGIDDSFNVYDADGKRIVRGDSTGVTIYLGAQEITISGGQVSATRYYTFGGTPVAVRTSAGLGGVSSLVVDAQGSLVASIPNTNWTASSVQRVYSDPFGAARDGSSTSVPGDHRYLSAVRDGASGLTLLGARFYDEELGRFISVDPVLDAAVPAQFNAYSYAWNNPLTRSDPTGLSAIGPGDTGCRDCQTPHPHQPKTGLGGNSGAGSIDGTNHAGPTIPQAIVHWILTNPDLLKMFQHPTKEQEEWIKDKGFARDQDGGYDSTSVAWQLWLGYMDPYDWVFDLGIPMRVVKFPFTLDDGTNVVVWGWKADYGNLGAGGEMAMYEQFGPSELGLWSAKYSEEIMPRITTSVTSALSGAQIAYSAPTVKQPWVATMNPYVQGADPDDLRLTSTMTFAPNVFTAFQSMYEGDPRLTFDSNNHMVTVRFRRKKVRR